MHRFRVSGWTRWNFVQTSCQPDPVWTFPSLSMMAEEIFEEA
jgi:hypothetical protein